MLGSYILCVGALLQLSYIQDMPLTWALLPLPGPELLLKTHLGLWGQGDQGVSHCVRSL